MGGDAGERETRGDGRRERTERNTDRRGERSERSGERSNDRRGADREAAVGQPADTQAMPHAAALADSTGVELDATSTSGEAQGAAPSDEARAPRERRSRDRYGRDRRERGERNGNAQNGDAGDNGSNGMNGGNANDDTVARAESPVSNQASEHASAAPAATESIAMNAMPAPAAQPAATPVAAAVPVVTPAAIKPAPSAPVAAAPAVATPAPGLPQIGSYDLPLQDLHAVAQTTGLQWVNSDTAKIAEAQAAIAAEAKPMHVPRERAPVVASQDTALVLVETKRDLAAMDLPFDKPAA